MKFLDWIVSLLSKPRSRRKSTVPEVHTAVPVITEKKTDAMSCFKSGIRNFTSAEYNAAIEDFTQAISIRKNFHQAFYNRGLTRLKTDDNQGANLDFTRAIEIHPVYAKAYLNRGIAKNRLGDPEGAQEDFNKSVKIDPALYPLFTVRKIQAEKADPVISADSLPEKQENTSNRDESIRTDAADEPENVRPAGSEIESDEEDFMKALVLESLKDEYSSQSPVPESEDFIISTNIPVADENDSDNGTPGNIIEEDHTEEYSFEELTSEDEQDELPVKGAAAPDYEEIAEENYAVDGPAEEEEGEYSGKPTVSGDEIPDLPESFIPADEDENEEYDNFKKHIPAEAEKADPDKGSPAAPKDAENEVRLQGLKPKPLENELTSLDNNKKIAAAFDSPDDEHPEDDLKKYNFSETGISDDEIRQIFLTDEGFGEEEDQLPADMPEPPEEDEKQNRRVLRTSNDPAEEARMLSEIDNLDQEFNIELPEQSEIQRILAESLPESKLNYAKGYYYRAKVKLQAGDKTGAMEDFSNAIEFYPKFSQAFLHRGNIESELNELPEAIADYSKAIEYHHKNPTAYYKRALANQKAENNREALADFTKAILFDPRNPKLYLFRGILRYKMGQARAAFSDWSRAELLGLPQARELLQKYALKAKKGKK